MNVTHLRTAAREMKKAILPVASISLLGTPFRAAYETRGARADRDYAFLQACARDKRCIFDVGANKGLTALVMAAVQPGHGRLVAFEASELACEVIQENVWLNNLTGQVTVVNAVVAERSGLTLDFYLDAASGGASTLADYLGHTRPLQKTALALDDYVQQSGQTPDLIKIDVEGAESRVLQGLAGTLDVHRPWVVLELHSWNGTSVAQNAAAILSQLAAVGYQMWYLKTKSVVTDADVFIDRGRCHALLLPQETAVPGWFAAFDTTGL